MMETTTPISFFALILGLLLLLLPLPFGLVMLFGGWRMMQGKSYGLAVTASILALLPCHPASLLGLVFGVWSLVVLSRSNVKAAFEPRAHHPPPHPA
jgi:hypothetical protein